MGQHAKHAVMMQAGQWGEAYVTFTNVVVYNQLHRQAPGPTFVPLPLSLCTLHPATFCYLSALASSWIGSSPHT